MNNRTKLQAIYDSLPKMACQGKCQQCCGPIGLFPAEIQNLQESNQAIPCIFGDLTCSALRQGQCSIYADRPLICRLWGLTKRMQCPFGCQPDRWLSDKEAKRLMDAIAKLKPGKPHLTIDTPKPRSIVELQ